ncbi:MAG: alanine racemase, partial [Bifidobacteriaceae bacterium]|nr:alanine racemase [Bifidobacteriaceae bacterium]
MGNNSKRETKCVINTKIISDNVKQIIKYNSDYKYYIGVVKGNAYGHGYEIVKTLVNSGINYLAVSDLDEANQVREFDKKTPILCLEPVDLMYMDFCSKNNITMTISSYSYFENLKSKLDNAKNMKFHLKLNTGMNRLGLDKSSEIEEIFDYFNDSDHILEGIYTHLGVAGAGNKYYKNAVQKFEELTSSIELSKIPIVHLFRSATIEQEEKLPYATGIRPGVLMFGGTQSKPAVNIIKRLLKPKPINSIANYSDLKIGLSVKSKIIETRDVLPEEIVGYGLDYIADDDIKIGIIPIGYADNFGSEYVG